MRVYLESESIQYFSSLIELSRQLLFNALCPLASLFSSSLTVYLQPIFSEETLSLIKSEISLALATSSRLLDQALSAYLTTPMHVISQGEYGTDKSCPVRLPS